MGDISEPLSTVTKLEGSEVKDGTKSEITLELILDSKCFKGRQKIYRHYSSETKCFMKFSIYIPDSETDNPDEKFDTVFFLSGAMCNEQNFLFKMGFQKYASDLKLIVVGPDTSPRNVEFPGDRDSFVFGRSAGWYVDATEEPWSTNYRMYSYVTKELFEIINKFFPTTGKIGLCGHSMGGNGAVVIGLRNPEQFQSLSLLAPSCNPTSWGDEVIFKRYLGEDKHLWYAYDASHVIKEYDGPFRDILLDQGAEDKYLTYLVPETLKRNAEENPNKSVSVNLRMYDDYEHSYYFAATFIEDHLKYHAEILRR